MSGLRTTPKGSSVTVFGRVRPLGKYLRAHDLALAQNGTGHTDSRRWTPDSSAKKVATKLDQVNALLTSVFVEYILGVKSTPRRAETGSTSRARGSECRISDFMFRYSLAGHR